MITKVEGTLSTFLTNEQPKSAAKDTVGLPQPRNVTGGLDVQDMFKYFTLETSQKIYISISYWYFFKVLFVPLLHDRAVNGLCHQNVCESVCVCVCARVCVCPSAPSIMHCNVDACQLL